MEQKLFLTLDPAGVEQLLQNFGDHLLGSVSIHSLYAPVNRRHVDDFLNSEKLVYRIAGEVDKHDANLKLVLESIKKAEAKHPNHVANLSDMALVIAEEGGEVADAVLKYFYEGGSYEDIKKELAHVATVALRGMLLIDKTAKPARIAKVSGSDPLLPGDEVTIYVNRHTGLREGRGKLQEYLNAEEEIGCEKWLVKMPGEPEPVVRFVWAQDRLCHDDNS